MSKPKTATDGGGQQALTAPGSNGGAPTALVPTHDELATLSNIEFDNDGLGDVGPEDIRIAAKVFNMKGVDQKGRKIPEDAFYDTIDETVKDRLDAAFLHLHKTNMYSVFDNGENRTRIVCRSFDRVTGTMDDGTVRPCKGCPDAEWRTETVDGKNRRTRNCGPVYNMFAVDREAGLPFVIRFKRTSLPVIKSYLQKHHIGRRVMMGGKRANYPLFCFRVDISCKMDEGGKYALPVLNRGSVLNEDEIRSLAENARTLRESVLPILNQVETQVEEREKPDTSFDPDKFADGEGQDFVDSPAA